MVFGVVAHAAPCVVFDGLSAPGCGSVRPELEKAREAAADARGGRERGGLVARNASGLGEFVDMALQFLDLRAFGFGDAAGVGDADADVVGVAFDHRRCVGGGGGLRFGRFGGPLPSGRAGVRGALLVAGGEGFGEPDAGGRDAAGGGAGVDDGRSVAGDGEGRALRGVSGVAPGVDVGGCAQLAALQGRVSMRVELRVCEGDVAGCALAGGGSGGLLADGEDGGGEDGGLADAVGEGGGEEGDRHRQVSGHDGDVGGDGADPGLGDEGYAGVASGHQRCCGHALGGLAHGDAVEDGVERPPTLDPHQPGDP